MKSGPLLEIDSTQAKKKQKLSHISAQLALTQAELNNVSAFPAEIWVELAKYLGPEDLEAFKLVCQAFNKLTEQNADMLWQRLLNRLHAIDKTIKTTPQPGKTIRETFIAGFFIVKQRQHEDIIALSQEFSAQNRPFEMHVDPNQSITLEILENQSKQLDEIHCTIIQEVIDQSSGTELNLYNTPYTLRRFPQEILERNTAYFKNLRKLNLCMNKLRSIPDNIDVCENLEEFNCSENHELEALPESLCNITRMKTLSCYDNILSKLPEKTGDLLELEVLDCSNNQIICLPKAIGNLIKLKSLNIANNLIDTLPESMLNILSDLAEYDFSYNDFHCDQNRRIDGIDNSGFISFIQAQHSLPGNFQNWKQDNDLTIWQPLVELLDCFDIKFKLNTNSTESLRNQFIEQFQFHAKWQAKTLLTLIKLEDFNKYNIVMDIETYELSFSDLSVSQLIENENIIENLTQSRDRLQEHTRLFFNDMDFSTDIPSLEDDIEADPYLDQPKFSPNS